MMLSDWTWFGLSLSTGSWMSKARCRFICTRMKITSSTSSTSIMGVMLGSEIDELPAFPIEFAIRTSQLNDLLRVSVLDHVSRTLHARFTFGHRRDHERARLLCDLVGFQDLAVLHVLVGLQEQHLVIRMLLELGLQQRQQIRFLADRFLVQVVVALQVDAERSA